MTTAISIIEGACKKIHVLGRGQTLSNDEATRGLSVLNNLLASWSVEGGMVYTESKDTLAADGSTSYTIGSGGDLDTTKPFDIASVFITQGTTTYPTVKYDQKQYAGISTKSTTGIPTIYYYDNNYPLANLYLHPVPSAGYTINIYSMKPLTAFTGLTTDIAMPSGYVLALEDALAIQLAPEYNREPTPQLIKNAADSKATIFKYNVRNSNNVADADSALVPSGGYDIYRGY